jgi:predicted transcriptional regulator YdeE
MARGSTLEPLSGPALRLKYPRADASREIDMQEDFIAIGKKKRKIAQLEGPKDRVEAFWDEEEQRNQKSLDEQEESEEEELDVELEETEEQTRRRVIVDFERKLKEAPEDIEMWIAYAQLHLTKGSTKASSKETRGKSEQISTAKRAEAEVATEILSKAFRASGKNKSNPRLHSAFFKLVQLFWPEHRVTASWKAVLSELTERGGAEDQAGLMDLWFQYIDWREGRGLGSQNSQNTADGQSGGIEDVIEVYIECIGIMRIEQVRKDLKAPA